MMDKSIKNVERILKEAAREGSEFEKRTFGRFRIGGLLKTITSTAEASKDFIDSIHGLDEKAAMAKIGISKTTVFRIYKWFSRAINSYDAIVVILVYHLKRRGAPLYRINDILDILEDIVPTDEEWRK